MRAIGAAPRDAAPRRWCSPRCTTSPSPGTPRARRRPRSGRRRRRGRRGGRHAGRADRRGGGRWPRGGGRGRGDRAVRGAATRRSPRRRTGPAPPRSGWSDVGCGAGFDLSVDRVGHHLQRRAAARRPVVPGAGVVLGRGRPAGPRGAMPEVAARIGVDLDPLDAPTRTTPGGCAPACRRTGRSRRAGWRRSWRSRRPTLRCCCAATPSSCCPTPSPGCRPTPCPSSPRPGRCRASRAGRRPRFLDRLGQAAAGPAGGLGVRGGGRRRAGGPDAR